MPASVHDIKLAILDVLVRGGRSEHKINVIGRRNQRGRAEDVLGVTFTPQERTLADQAFEELKAARLVQATYEDAVDPERWVVITEAGRRALERRCLDDLDEALASIHPRLIDMRRGGWWALASGQPDAVRQAAHSGRELVDQVLHELAPLEEVRAQPWFQPDKTSRSGVTRRMRVRLAMQKSRGEVSDSDLAVADLLYEVLANLEGLAHAHDVPRAADARDALQAAELALRRMILPPRQE